MQYNAGLVLEGGGMRGMYTVGVLDYLLDAGIDFSTVYGVSAGSCHACSYLSHQRGRAYKVCIDYLDNKNYCGIYSFITTGDMFGVKLNFYDIPNIYEPYDYEEFLRSNTEFYAVLTSLQTGKAEYHRISDVKKDIERVRASSSLPLVSRIVYIDGKPYLDGGIGDSIPLAASMKKMKKNVVVLTQHNGYRKKPNSMMPAIKLLYHKYPDFVKANEVRHDMYNGELDLVSAEEKAGRAFVFRPAEPVTIGRLEKDREKLTALYNNGYNDAKQRGEELISFLTEE